MTLLNFFQTILHPLLHTKKAPECREYHPEAHLQWVCKQVGKYCPGSLRIHASLKFTRQEFIKIVIIHPETVV